MGFWELLLIGLALSMDAFAAAVCKGMALGVRSPRHALITGGFFGFFQALMPLTGYLLGKSFAQYIQVVDHWIAFGLLAGIGIHMLLDAKDSCDIKAPSFDLREMLLLSVATSIDALAVGVSFAFLNVAILPAVGTIGLITFSLSGIGVLLGNLLGERFQKKAQILGAVILIGIGIKILVEHLIAG